MCMNGGNELFCFISIVSVDYSGAPKSCFGASGSIRIGMSAKVHRMAAGTYGVLCP
jgi:hypothetical protein